MKKFFGNIQLNIKTIGKFCALFRRNPHLILRPQEWIYWFKFQKALIKYSAMVSVLADDKSSESVTKRKQTGEKLNKSIELEYDYGYLRPMHGEGAVVIEPFNVKKFDKR